MAIKRMRNGFKLTGGDAREYVRQLGVKFDGVEKSSAPSRTGMAMAEQVHASVLERPALEDCGATTQLMIPCRCSGCWKLRDIPAVEKNIDGAWCECGGEFLATGSAQRTGAEP